MTSKPDRPAQSNAETPKDAKRSQRAEKLKPQSKRKALSPDDPRHGTTNGYGNWGCRCRPCTDAHAALCAELRQRRVKAGLKDNDRRHGTANGYGNWGCRCAPCTDAWAEWAREAAEQRRMRKEGLQK